MRECVAWHSHVLTVTSPSPQRAKRLNLTAANASCANRQPNAEMQPNAKARTMCRFLTSRPQFFARTRAAMKHRLREGAADCQFDWQTRARRPRNLAEPDFREAAQGF